MASTLNDEVLALFPDYLFAKLNKALECIYFRQFEAVPALLGEEMELGLLYPDRSEFHFKEFLSYYDVAVRYFVAIGERELAINRLNLMKQFGEEAPEIIEVEQVIADAFEYHNDDDCTFEDEDDFPDFEHQEVTVLYVYGTEIEPVFLHTLLQFPAESFTRDLVLMLHDAKTRYENAREENDNR